MADVTTDMVWSELEKQLFGVMGMVTAEGQSRTSGVVYIVQDRKIYVGARATSWKVRHIEKNPNISLTATIHKSLKLMPWIKIPPATITFNGTARVLMPEDIDGALLREVYGDIARDPEAMVRSRIIEMEPSGDFVTYGVGVSLRDMRYPDRARGRAPVAASA